MGLLKLLKWIAIFILSTAFISLLFVTPFTFSLAEITKPEVMKPIFFSIMASMPRDDAETSQMEAQIRYDCQNRTELQLPLGDGKENITINCDDIRNNRTLNEAILDDLFDKIYYADYDCKFIECFSRQEEGEFPSFIFSKISNEFFTAASMRAVIIAIILAILLILTGGIRTVANNLIIAGLPFILLMIGSEKMLQSAAASEGLKAMLPLLAALSNLSYKIFGIFLAAGIILFLLSLMFRKKRKPEMKDKKGRKPEPKEKAKSLKKTRRNK